MQYVYILKSLYDSNLYVGCSHDLKKRLALHNSGKVVSTRNRIPLKLIYYEAYLHKMDAFERERFMKSGWGKRFIKKNLKHYFRD